MPEASSEQQRPHLTRRQLAAILGSAADGVIARDTAGNLVYANDAAAHLCGYPSGEAMLGASPDEVLSRFTLLDHEGRLLPPDQLPGRQVLSGHDRPETVVRFRVRETGEERWSMVHSTSMRDRAGRVQLAVSIFRDITERTALANRGRF